MLREEVLNSSRELVNQIYEKMNIIETCDSVIEKVKNLDVCFNDIDNKQVVSLDEILNRDQLSTVRENVINIIYSNAIDAQTFLEKLNRKPAIINPEFEAAVKEMESQSGKPGNKKIEFDITEMKDLYINQKLPLRKIAEHFGCAESTVHKFVKENNITRAVKEKTIEPVPKAYPVMTIEAVREIYTNGTMSLADTAKHFGITKDKLHNFVKENRIERPAVKPNDPFLDANKLSKEEFKRKMLNARK